MRAACLAWAADIGEALCARPRPLPLPGSLMNGEAGIALFLAYLGQTLGEDRYLEAAEEHLAEAAEGAVELGAFLHNGFTGSAWVLEHLAGHVLAPSEEDPHQECDEAVAAVLASPDAWRGRFEVMFGTAGLGIYAMERENDALIEAVVASLESGAEERAGGLAWFCEAEGAHVLGMAHGTAGIIAFLAAVHRDVPALRPRVARLLAGACAYLRAQRRPAGSRSAFPNLEGSTQTSPLGWCYGDLGVAVALWRAGQAVGDAGWTAEALDLARACVARSPKETSGMDAGFCHGTAGLAHIFRRLHRASGDPALGDIAAFWLEQTLARRRPGEGVAGVLRWDRPTDTWVPDAALLGGAAGVGLVLLDLAPGWDRIFLTDLA